MPEPAPPRRTGKPPQTVSLTGLLLALEPDGQPALLHVIGSPAYHLPCFSAPEKLRAIMGARRIVQITDGAEFLSSVPPEVIVIIDPWYTPEGRVRYTQVFRGSQAPSTCA